MRKIPYGKYSSQASGGDGKEVPHEDVQAHRNWTQGCETPSALGFSCLFVLGQGEGPKRKFYLLLKPFMGHQGICATTAPSSGVVGLTMAEFRISGVQDNSIL